jgi:hypothetical protein
LADTDDLVYICAGVRLAAHTIAAGLPEDRRTALEAEYAERDEVERGQLFDPTTDQEWLAYLRLLQADTLLWAVKALQAAEERWPDQAVRVQYFADQAGRAYKAQEPNTA